VLNSTLHAEGVWRSAYLMYS